MHNPIHLFKFIMKTQLFLKHRYLPKLQAVSAKGVNNKFSYGKLKSLFPVWVKQLGQRISGTLGAEPVVLSDSGVLCKGWRGTPLPLLPDIRHTEIKIGELDTLLSKYGIAKKTGGEVTLYPGPNKKANRYLDNQYKRIIKRAGGYFEWVPVEDLAVNSDVEKRMKLVIKWSII